MELYAKKSNFKKENNMFGLFSNIINKYAQEDMNTNPGMENPPVDPNTLQVGQQIYDQEGNSRTVIQNQDGTITTMPTDQAGQQIPQGVETIDPNEKPDEYSTTPPNQNVQARIAQDLGIDWEELESIALEVATYAQAEKEKAFFDALDRLNTAALSYVQLPTDLGPKDLISNKVSQQVEPSYLHSIETSLLQAFSDALDEIELESNYREPGYFETAMQGLLDSVQNDLIVNNITNLEVMAKEKFEQFLAELRNAADSEEEILDEHTQKLLQFYAAYLY